MKEKIEKMIEQLKTGRYNHEEAHIEYDELLEEFILNYDPALKELMAELISLKKDFWYA